MTASQDGTPREVRWTWESKDNDVRRGYMAVDGRVSITDLIAHMAEVAPGVDPADIYLNWVTATWTRPATAEEVELRRQAQAYHDARHEEWERKTFARLLAKFGTGAD